jgi:hypothetical protein
VEFLTQKIDSSVFRIEAGINFLIKVRDSEGGI